jgi:hypothetical protein
MSSLSEACDALTAFEGGRVSLLYDEPGFTLSVTARPRLDGGLFFSIPAPLFRTRAMSEGRRVSALASPGAQHSRCPGPR